MELFIGDDCYEKGRAFLDDLIEKEKLSICGGENKWLAPEKNVVPNEIARLRICQCMVVLLNALLGLL